MKRINSYIVTYKIYFYNSINYLLIETHNERKRYG